MEHYINLTEIDKKYKDKCSLIKAGKCKNVNIFLENSRELKKLKKENEDLKEHHYELEEKFLELNCKSYGYILENEKLKQVLTEIKEIAKNGCYDDCGMPLDELSIILQKISEVIDEK